MKGHTTAHATSAGEESGTEEDGKGSKVSWRREVGVVEGVKELCVSRKRLVPGYTALSALFTTPEDPPSASVPRRLLGVRGAEAAPAADPLHVAAAAAARVRLPAQSLPGHGDQGGDLSVDQPDRGEGQGEYLRGCL